MPKFKPYNQNQPMLLPPDIKDWIPDNHICFVINDIVDRLNIDSIIATYSEDGCPAYNPRALIKTMFYSYTRGIRSSRKIENGCRENIVMRYLSANQQPDHGTISLFRKNHLGHLEDMFAQIVIICKGLRIIDPAKISVDGSIFKANASWKNTFDKKSIAKLKKKIRGMLEQAEQVDREEDERYGPRSRGECDLPEKLQDQETRQKEIERLQKKLKQINQAEKTISQKQEKVKNKPKEERELKKNTTHNTTDPEANIMKMKNGQTYKPAYNGQISTSNQVILAYDITDNADDTDALIPMTEKTENNTGEKIESVAADSKYFSKDNIEKLTGREIDAYIPDQRKTLEERQERNNEVPEYDRRNFKYNPDKDEFVCPQGRRLCLAHKNGGHRVYFGSDCVNCPVKTKCTKGKFRRISIDHQLEEYKTEMREKLNGQDGKHRYLERLGDVEPPISNITYNLQARNFLCRGKPMVKTELGLSCIAHNLVKIANWITKNNSQQQFDALMRLQAIT